MTADTSNTFSTQPKQYALHGDVEQGVNKTPPQTIPTTAHHQTSDSSVGGVVPGLLQVQQVSAAVHGQQDQLPTPRLYGAAVLSIIRQLLVLQRGAQHSDQSRYFSNWCDTY